MATAKLGHIKLQTEILANSIGQKVFDSVSTMEAGRRANLRLRQENTSVAINPAEEESHMHRVTTLINHLVSQGPRTPRIPSTTRAHRLRTPTRRLYIPRDRGKKSIHLITSSQHYTSQNFTQINFF
jgi:hypothetical protein